jgi:signal transduction histidine kinase
MGAGGRETEMRIHRDRFLKDRQMDHPWCVQIVCADPELARHYRSELENAGKGYCLLDARSIGEAQRNFLRIEPTVILFDGAEGTPVAQGNSLESMVGLLSETAPVVVVGPAEWQSEFAFLITSGAVDFVERSGDYVGVAAGLAERRIHLAISASKGALGVAGEPSDSDFGEILRHEVNNPLTGILGNAEMLLARKDHLPAAVVERVETIAELAVRLRETVRRLSHTWDEGHDHVGTA